MKFGCFFFGLEIVYHLSYANVVDSSTKYNVLKNRVLSNYISFFKHEPKIQLETTNPSNFTKKIKNRKCITLAK